jgi:hypothetical protein
LSWFESMRGSQLRILYGASSKTLERHLGQFLATLAAFQVLPLSSILAAVSRRRVVYDFGS